MDLRFLRVFAEQILEGKIQQSSKCILDLLRIDGLLTVMSLNWLR